MYFISYVGFKYEENDDKYLIGYILADKSKFKDVVTGQVVDGEDARKLDLSCHHSHRFDYKIRQLLSDMNDDGFFLCIPASSMLQSIKAHMIKSKISKEIISTKDIAWIKKIMNEEICKTRATRVACEIAADIRKREQKERERKLEEKYGLKPEDLGVDNTTDNNMEM